jgi:Ca-activated chloride channel family protein
MTFAQPMFLFVLILLPVMWLFLLWAGRRRATAIARLGQPTLLERLSAHVNWRGRRWQTRLWFLALALLILALARPQWGSEVQVVEQQGLQVMVALDVSKSMLAEDIKPNRLGRAKLEIADLMDHLGGDEIGLALFSGASFIQFPLTSDYATARSFVDAARPEVISKPGTAIGEALRVAMSGFDAKFASQKVIVLITDGEDHAPDTLDAAQQIADEGALIYAIGFGSPQGEPIPEYNAQGEVTGYKKDQQGQVVLSKLDEITLERIAQIGHGQYYRASASGSELDALASELNRLQKAELSTQFETRGIERFQSFLLVALAALMMIELIPDRLRSRAAHSAALGRRWLGWWGQRSTEGSR